MPVDSPRQGLNQEHDRRAETPEESGKEGVCPSKDRRSQLSWYTSGILTLPPSRKSTQSLFDLRYRRKGDRISLVLGLGHRRFVPSPPPCNGHRSNPTNEDGEEVSSREVKKILQECVESENKKKPLTDDALTKILKAKGYNIARRTIAKYREMLEIPVARLRKQL